MKRRAYAKKRDANEPEIVDALKAIGASVYRMDIVDLLVGYKKQTYLIEVKTGTGKPTQAQLDFVKHWRGNRLHFCTTVDESLRAIGAIE